MSLRLFFTVPVLLLFIFTVGLVSLISYLNGQQAALHYGQKLADQISLRINSHLQYLLVVPKTVSGFSAAIHRQWHIGPAIRAGFGTLYGCTDPKCTLFNLHFSGLCQWPLSWSKP